MVFISSPTLSKITGIEFSLWSTFGGFLVLMLKLTSVLLPEKFNSVWKLTAFCA